MHVSFKVAERIRLQEAQLLLGDRATRKHAKDFWNGRGNDNLGWNDLQMYFNVIKSGTNRKLMYDFLLVICSNFCRITHRFWEIWCDTVQWPWNIPKVIDSRITWIEAVVWPYGGLLVENRQFVPTPPSFNALAQGDPLRILGWSWYPQKLEWCGYHMVNKSWS